MRPRQPKPCAVHFRSIPSGASPRRTRSSGSRCSRCRAHSRGARGGRSQREICFACHGDKGAKGTAKSIAVDDAAFAKSVRRDEARMHRLPRNLGEGAKLQPDMLRSCMKAVKEYGRTVHGMARKGGSTAAADLRRLPRHARHQTQQGSGLRAPATAGLKRPAASATATRRWCARQASRRQRRVQLHDSIHGRALAGAARASAPTCTNCHGAHNIHPNPDPKIHDPSRPILHLRRLPSRSVRISRRASTANCARKATSRRRAAVTATVRTRFNRTTCRCSRLKSSRNAAIRHGATWRPTATLSTGR